MATFEIRTHKGEPYQPLPTQQRFHQSKAKYRSYIGYLNAGKSLCGSVEALLRAVKEPGHRPGKTLICRAFMSDLIDSTWATFAGVVKNTCPDLIAYEKASNHEIRMGLKNGWTYIGRHLQRWDAFGSMDLVDDIWVDEINDDGVGQPSYAMLCGRLERGMFDAALWNTGNPGGKNWLYDLYFRHKLEGGKPRPNHAGFQPLRNENYHFAQSYWDDLEEIFTADQIEKFLNGSFDVFEGQILDTFDPRLHVIDSFRPPDEWPRYFGLDHGWNHPTAGLWMAMDHDGNHYYYREHLKRSAVPAENVALILGAEKAAGETEEMFQWRRIDPSTRQTQTAGGVAQQIIDQYRDAGLYCQFGNNDVKASIARIKGLMLPDESHLFPAWHPRAGEFGAPHFYVCRDLKATIHQLSNWKWKQYKLGAPAREKPLDKDDDLVACVRYIEMDTPRAPVVQPRDPLDWLKAAIEERDGASSHGLDLEYIGA